MPAPLALPICRVKPLAIAQLDITYPPGLNLQRQHASHRDIVKRLKRAHGHLASVIAMIEAGRSCVDLAQQLHAVESAIAVDAALPLADALAIATALQNELAAHMPELAVAKIRFGGHRAGAPSGAILRHHAPERQGIIIDGGGGAAPGFSAAVFFRRHHSCIPGRCQAKLCADACGASLIWRFGMQNGADDSQQG